MSQSTQGTLLSNFHPRSSFIKLLSAIFNIAPSQWSRVSECWLITFFFKIGSAIGWTVLTASFVAQFGIALLPILFIANAALIMAGTFFFERLIVRVKREILMVQMLIVAAMFLFIATFLYIKSIFAFFTLVIVAESVFLAQFNIFIPLLVSDRFTPLESQRTFPFIESGETIGGILGGILVGIFATQVNIVWFIYLWMLCVIFTTAVFFVKKVLGKSVPTLFAGHGSHGSRKDQIKLVMSSIKKLPLLKGIVLIVMLQWVFMNILEFQYTKAIEQAVTGRSEPTIAHVDPQVFQVALLTSPEGSKRIEKMRETAHAAPSHKLSQEQQALLTEKLGTFKSMFHVAALVVQVLFASRLITALGIVGSLLLHPIIMLMSIVGIFLKFGQISAALARTNYEITNVVHKNAYFASHYAFPLTIRHQAAEFIEGIVRPCATIVSMLFIVTLHAFFVSTTLSLSLHIVMAIIMAGLLVITLRLQKSYTDAGREQLLSELPYPEHLNAIEILAQKGHKNAPHILIQKLQTLSKDNESHGNSVVRIKLISALAQCQDEAAIPEFIDSLYHENPEVRLEAAQALMNFHSLGNQFYSQAFSRYRLIEALKEIFRKEQSASVRSAIIQLFSLLQEPAIVAFLTEVLSDQNPKVRADCIYTLGLFKDPMIAHYVMPFLNDEDPYIRANVLIALSQFPAHAKLVKEHLNKMRASNETEALKAWLFASGEIDFISKKTIFPLLSSEHEDLKVEAAFALVKKADSAGIPFLVNHFLTIADSEFFAIKRFVRRLENGIKKNLESVIIENIAQYIEHVHSNPENINKLRRLYLLIDEHEELARLEEAFEKSYNSSGAAA